MPLETNDRELLLTSMMKLGNGIYEPLDADGFSDPELAQTFNDMLKNVARRNNNYLMRINKSMEKLGNGSWLKKIFEIIEDQQLTLVKLREHESVFEDAVKKIDNSSVDILNSLCQIDSNIEPTVSGMEEIVQEITCAMEKGCDEKSMEKIIRLIEFNQSSLGILKQNIDSAILVIKDIYEEEKNKKDAIEPIVANIKVLEETCSELSIDCIHTGRHIHEISRLVDNVRNDMFRGNTDPTMRDSLRVYCADHIVLTWRLYNHVMEYEVLKIEQLNNKERCKFGVWCNMTSPQWIRETDEFKHAIDAHNELHFYAVRCFEACESMNRPLALQEFERMLGSLDKFQNALEEVHGLLVRKGISDETGILSGNIF